jgi:ABC-2 type transport system ATP-binding protein
VPGDWQAHPVTLEELVLAYLREPGASALPGPEALGADAVTGVMW